MDRILHALFSAFARADAVTAIHYGNRGGRDDDVFLIVRGNHAYESRKYERLDITLIGEDWLPQMVDHLDPVVTEPLLTGTMLWGAGVDQWIARMHHARSDKGAADYLAFHGRLFLEWARQHAEEDEHREALTNLSFAAGFTAFGFYYREYPHAASLTQLLDDWDHPSLPVLDAIRKSLARENYDHYAYAVFAHETNHHCDTDMIMS